MDETTSRPREAATDGDGPSAVELEAKLFRGLGDARRLVLLRLLVSGPRTAGDLARLAQLSPSGASNHLRCLLECGLVLVESDGRFNRYRLADVGVAGLLLGAEQLLSRVAREIEACLNYGPPSRRALRARPVAHAGRPSMAGTRRELEASAHSSGARGKPGATEGSS
jgi:DNA-binding transcriptional ArsR family regulator